MNKDNWDLFQQQAETLRAQPSESVWTRIAIKMEENKQVRRLRLRKRVRMAVASAAAVSLLLVLMLPEFAIISTKSNGIANQIQDITPDRMVAESFRERAEWSARFIQTNTPITEGSEHKRLIPRNY